MSDAPEPYRLRIGTNWEYLEVVRDPFVLYTARGYAAAVEVKRGNFPHFMFVSAASLARPLEDIRKQKGSLIGIRIRVRKTGSDQMAGYEVQLIGDNP